MRSQVIFVSLKDYIISKAAETLYMKIHCLRAFDLQHLPRETKMKRGPDFK